MAKETILCPSSVCMEGSALLGIVNAVGTIDLLAEPLPIDENFVQEAKKGRKPETRFRFTNTCVQKECRQWNGQGCGVIEKIQNLISIEESLQQLPECGIRSRCRWYLQTGSSACSACIYVITDDPITASATH
jgi:hypothetical protein